MIDRYTRPEMGHVFSLQNKYAVWQKIEVLTCEAHAELGEIGITREEASWIREHASFDKDEIWTCSGKHKVRTECRKKTIRTLIYVRFPHT